MDSHFHKFPRCELTGGFSPQEDVSPWPEDQSGVRGLGQTPASHHLAQGWDRAELLLRTRTCQSVSPVTSTYIRIAIAHST